MEGDFDPKYTEICSAQTIQSNEKGFFNELYESVKKLCSNKWINTEFKNSHGDGAKIRCLFTESDASDMLLGMLEHVAPVYKQKNAQFSAQRRREGEQLIQRGADYSKALILLSQAVLRAPEKYVDTHVDGGLSLAFALWTRSAVLLELGDGKSAISDLQHSITCGLPAKQHGAYYLRLARANARKIQIYGGKIILFNNLFFFIVDGAKAKAQICINLAEKFCQDSETQCSLEALKTELSSIQVQIHNQIQGICNFCLGASKEYFIF